jgi:acyl-CoA synthetase (AMP-forming)/AMP-acid ligase II
MLVLNGRNYYAHEIEAIVNDVPGVVPGRVVALSVENRDADSAVAVVLAETHREVDAAAFRTNVRRAIQERLGLAIHDAAPMEAGSLVKTTSGKISRSANKALYMGIPA